MDAETAHGVLTKYLKSTGKHRSTPERFAILDAVLETQGHFDAEGLYYRLMSQGTRVSKATVYNTLEILKGCGLVAKYRFAEQTARYEKSFGQPHHHHLICLDCGDIIEVVSERLERIQDDVCSEKDFTPQSSTFQIFGTCAKCRKRT